MTPADLRSAGCALYGAQRWQSQLARAVGVTPRTVRRWLTGERPMPARLETELQRLLDMRAGEIASLRQWNPALVPGNQGE